MARRDWIALVNHYAKLYNVDAAAALAVASMEGLSGRVGDQGTSFGPFQLHVGGALPAGKGRAWAESPAGIEYAIKKMSEVAGGLTGADAVRAIVTRFERPADPGKEIAGALTHLGGGSEPNGSLPTALTGAGSLRPPSFTKQDAEMQGLKALAEGNYDPRAGLAALKRAAEATATAMSSQQKNIGSMALPITVQGPASSRARKAASMVQQYLGVNYKWGGESPQGFDCSGLLQWVWGHLGVKIPRTSQQQWKAGRAVGKGALRPGDAVFFEATSSGPGHVGMYIGGGMFVEAPHTGAVVRISKLRGRTDYVGARRYG